MGIIVRQNNPKRVDVEKKPYGAVYVKVATETPIVTEDAPQPAELENADNDVQPVIDEANAAKAEDDLAVVAEAKKPVRRAGRKPKRK